MKKSVVFLMLFLSLCLGATNVKVQIDKVPFSLAPVCDVDALNDSDLKSEVSTLRKGTVVEAVAWSYDRRHLKVFLADGSCVYVPALAFVRIALSAESRQIKGMEYSESADLSRLNHYGYLPAGDYSITDVIGWDLTPDGLAPTVMVCRSLTGEGRYFASNYPVAEYWRGLDFYGAAIEKLRALPTEENPTAATLYLMSPGWTVLRRYAGKDRDDIERAIGAPSSWLKPGANGKNERLIAYYPALVWRSNLSSGRLNLGAEICYDESGFACEGFGNACITVDKKAVKTEKLPKVGVYEESALDRAEARFDVVQRLYLSLGSLFFPNIFLRLLELALLSFVLVFVEWLKVKRSLKLGSNKTAVATSFAIPFFIMLILSPAYTAFSWIWNIVFLIVIAYAIFLPWMNVRRGIRRYRCADCHRYSPPTEFTGKHTSRIYVHEKVYIGRDAGEYKDTRYDPTPETGVYNETIITGDLKEDVWVFQLRQDLTTFKRCIRCSHEWDYKDITVIEEREYTLDSHLEHKKVTNNAVAFIKGRYGKLVRLVKTGYNEFRDSKGNVYRKRGWF